MSEQTKTEIYINISETSGVKQINMEKIKYGGCLSYCGIVSPLKTLLTLVKQFQHELFDTPKTYKIIFRSLERLLGGKW